MRIQTTDPINGIDVTDIHAPFIIEGTGDNALKIYFTSSKTRQLYIDAYTAEPDTYAGSFYTNTISLPQVRASDPIHGSGG